MRSLMSGCVLNQLVNRSPRSGLTMKRCADAGLACVGTRSAAYSSLRSAEISGRPSPSRRAAPASSSYSREREIASWISVAASA